MFGGWLVGPSWILLLSGLFYLEPRRWGQQKLHCLTDWEAELQEGFIGYLSGLGASGLGDIGYKTAGP